MSFRHSNPTRLLVATLVHFTVDFYGGLTIPLPQPTLIDHLGVRLSTVVLILGATALLINVIQPLSGALLPRQGMPQLLFWSPAAAACTALLGLTSHLAGFAALLVIAAIGIGVVHPEAAMVGHALAGKRKGLGVSLLMSGGYFGFACGSLVAGVWVEHQNQGLQGFWLLTLPAAATMALVWYTGLHRFHDSGTDDDARAKEQALPFAPVLALCICIAASMCVIVRVLSILMVRRFPDADPQGWSGAAVFASGVTGALASLFWGHVSERCGRGAIICLVQFLAIPFIYLLLHINRPGMAPVYGAGIGATIGGVFPLSVVLARQARGCGQRLRLGLAIGGAWGTGEVLFIFIGRYIDRFDSSLAAPVVTGMSTCWGLMLGSAALAAWLAYRERCRPA